MGLTVHFANVLWPVVLILFYPTVSLILGIRRLGLLSIVKVGRRLWCKIISWRSHLLNHGWLWFLVIHILEASELGRLVLRVLAFVFDRSLMRVGDGMNTRNLSFIRIELIYLAILLLLLSKLSGTGARLKLLRYTFTSLSSFGREDLIFERTGIVVSVSLMRHVLGVVAHFVMILLLLHRHG